MNENINDIEHKIVQYIGKNKGITMKELIAHFGYSKTAMGKKLVELKKSNILCATRGHKLLLHYEVVA
jgi:DeoR/GlpR family transcriptional regulator of sugar metabolism